MPCFSSYVEKNTIILLLNFNVHLINFIALLEKNTKYYSLNKLKILLVQLRITDMICVARKKKVFPMLILPPFSWMSFKPVRIVMSLMVL